MMQDLLQGESILYSVFPVYGYDDIVSHTEKGMQDDSEVSATYFVRYRLGNEESVFGFS